MKILLRLALIVCTFAWTTSGWGEVKNLDQGVINDWMRSIIVSDSDATEIKRVLHTTTMEDWEESWVSFHVKYEIKNSNCQRTLTFYSTDQTGSTWNLNWAKHIEEDLERDSRQLQKPKVYVRAYKSHEPVSDFPILDLNVEFQVRDGSPVVVVSDEQDTRSTLSEFASGDSARVRIDAFDRIFQFRMNLKGFAEKMEWANEQCPLEDDQEDSQSTQSS